jgi:hypothetical protein
MLSTRCNASLSSYSYQSRYPSQTTGGSWAPTIPCQATLVHPSYSLRDTCHPPSEVQPTSSVQQSAQGTDMDGNGLSNVSSYEHARNKFLLESKLKMMLVDWKYEQASIDLATCEDEEKRQGILQIRATLCKQYSDLNKACSANTGLIPVMPVTFKNDNLKPHPNQQALEDIERNRLRIVSHLLYVL